MASITILANSPLLTNSRGDCFRIFSEIVKFDQLILSFLVVSSREKTLACVHFVIANFQFRKSSAAARRRTTVPALL